MGNLSKPYTISVWDEVWNENEGRFVEERFAIIGANTMQSQNRALEPTLTRNVNGSKKFSFKMCKRYKDNITGETIINPFAEYLISERKIKLEYDGEWFDFIIKNISEDSSKYIYTYQCEDALVNELSKNGFGVTLDSESVNNSGTLQEIAETVLEDTDWEVESDVIVQTIEEPLVYIQIPANTKITPVLDQDENDKTSGVSRGTQITLSKASKVLAFYSSCRNKPTHFQFIYFADENKYGKGVVEHNEDKVITEKNCQYYIEYLNPDSYTANVQDYGFILPGGFSMIAQSGGADDTADTTISTWHRGARYVFSQETVYEPKLKRYVTKHKKGNEEYRSYTSSEYISPELVQNIMTNTDFKTSSGWTGTHFSTIGSAKATAEAAYGRFDDSGNFVSAINDLTNGDVYDEQYKNHAAFMKLVMPPNTYVINSGPYDNRISIGQMEIGSEWALAIRTNAGYDLKSVEYELGEYEYNPKTNGYKQIDSGIKFEKQTEKKDGYTIFKVISNPYLNKKEFKENSNVRLRIKNTSSSKITRYIRTATLFRVHYTKNGKIVVPGNDLTTQGNDIGFVEEKYYYYKPIEINNFSEEADFQPSVCLDKPTYETYKPSFHMGAEKIRSVTAKESNYFNILQTLAETFETWMLIEVERNSSGQITKKKIKYKQYIGEKNYANFRYGVNLKDVKRVFESKALVTKLIVKDNSNEFAKNGFCTVARAKANPLGENCLYDFQYYFNTGIMNARDHLDTMYTTNGAVGQDINTSHSTTNAIGYYPRIRAINDKLDSFTETIAALNTGLIRLKADAEVEKAAKEAAESGAEEAANEFAYLTGYDIRNYENNNTKNESSNVRKQLAAYTTCMTELNRATTELKRLEGVEGAEPGSEEEGLIPKRERQIKEEQEKFNTHRDYKIALNKAFYTKYSRFIQEGTWIDEEYIDDEKYYADAQSVLYNSCYPQVTYSINVLSLSALPGYEMFKFGLGDRTFVEDPEFFGREYKEEVVLTEFVENLDSPEKNTIKVQNFKNQFQDLFQKITATVQQAQYRTGSYEKAAALAEATSAKKYQFLTEALAGAEAILSTAGQQTVIVDKSGITVTDDDSPCNQIRLIGGAILISTDDGNGVKKWKTAMTHQGISASLITAGVINAGEISIMNSEEPAFRWDAFGLTAFDATWFDGVVSDTKYTKFVRMDKHGLYGIGVDTNEEDLTHAVVVDGRTWHAGSIDDIDNYASFALTWKGLKVIGDNNVIARIGRNDLVYNDEKKKLVGNIVSITKTVKNDKGENEIWPLFVVNTEGEVSMKIVSDLDERMETKFGAQDGKISAKVSKKSSEDSGTGSTRYCEWNLTPDEFWVEAVAEGKTGGIVVDKDGLTVTGILNAEKGGNIGGFTIKSTALYNKKTTLGSSTEGVYLGTNGISLGTYNNSGPAFKVTADGSLTAVKGTIGGFTIGETSLRYGNKNAVDSTKVGVYLGTDGISVGQVRDKDGINRTAFSVSADGTATIRGTIYATSLTLGEGVTVNTKYIDGLDKVLADYTKTLDLENTYILKKNLTVETKTEDGKQTTTINFNGIESLVITYPGKYVLTDVGMTGYTEDGVKRYAMISSNGLLEAHNAIIYGTIYANAGEIGGCSITNGKLEISAANITGTLTIGQIPGTIARKSDIPSDDHITKITNTTITTTDVIAKNLKVKAANITDTLTFTQLPGTVAKTSDLPTKLSELVNDEDFKNGTQVTTITEDTIKTTDVIAQNLVVKAAHIEGALTIGQIPGTVAKKTDLPTKLSELVNDEDFKNGTQVTTITEDTIKTTDVIAEKLKVKAANIDGDLDLSSALGGINISGNASGTWWTAQQITFDIYGIKSYLAAESETMKLYHPSKLQILSPDLRLGSYNASELFTGLAISASGITVYQSGSATTVPWDRFLKNINEVL